MSQKRRLAHRVGMVAILAVVAGCATAEDAGPGAAAPETIEATPEMVAQGGQVYAGAGNCRLCHGPSAEGGALGPDLTDNDWIWIDADSPTILSEVAAIIENGIPEPREFDSPMPAMGGGNLSDEDVVAAAAYILSLNE